jgi:hypothetical protein
MSSIFGVVAPRNFFQRDIPPSIRQCCRSLHLWYAATTKTSLGNHEIKSYVKAADLFKKSDREYLQRLDLWAEKPQQLIKKNVDLRTVLKEHIRPGIFLTRLRDSKPEAENSSPLRQYTLRSIDVNKVPSMSITRKGRGSSEFHILPGENGNPDHFSHCMYMAWHKLMSGKLVEFHIHQRGNLPNEDGFRKLVEENLHLWPDVIGKAMPKCSGTVVDPQTNFIKMCWVIGPPRKMENGDLTPPINVSNGLYVRKNHQHELDESGRGQRTKLEKKMRKKSKLKSVKSGEVRGKESGSPSPNLKGKKGATLKSERTGEGQGKESRSSSPNVKGKKEFILKYVKTGKAKDKESGSESPHSSGEKASCTNPTRGGPA